MNGVIYKELSVLENWYLSEIHLWKTICRQEKENLTNDKMFQLKMHLCLKLERLIVSQSRIQCVLLYMLKDTIGWKETIHSSTYTIRTCTLRRTITSNKASTSFSISKTMLFILLSCVIRVYFIFWYGTCTFV